MDALARGPGSRENYPAHKTGSEETLSKVQGHSPTAAMGVQPLWSWDPLGRKGSSHLPEPWAGVCSEWGYPGKERLEPGELMDSHLEKAEHCGLPPAPTSPSARVLLERGSVRALVWAVPCRVGYSQAGSGRGHPADEPRWATLTEPPHLGACPLILPCFVGLSV